MHSFRPLLCRGEGGGQLWLLRMKINQRKGGAMTLFYLVWLLLNFLAHAKM